ncbi:MAG TPA: branched-chain amino acid ABC transporter permease [Alphaproteobacteria bacterium]|nr:branched-chain amino acid ABC transporter permease [Alphaproteobacteria bacterium]
MEIGQLFLNALVLGASYALVALGFVLVLNATAAVNFAHGELVMAGGMLAVALSAVLPLNTGLPGLVLLPLVLLAMAGAGLLFSLAAYFPLRRGPPVSVFISTIAVGIILQHGIKALMGPAERVAPPLLAGPRLEFAGLVASRQALATLVVAALLIGGTALLLARTQFGRRLRASAQDPEMARAIGVRVPVMIAASFALGTALAGAAGLLFANSYFVSPGSGGNLMIKAYIAVTIGGWGSVPGALAGALMIAFFEVGVAAWLSNPVAEAALYGALLLTLVLRPQGLFGEPAGRRV